MSLRIGVMGAGAVGCYVGGRAAGAGSDVVFVGRERLKKEIDERGLSLVDLDGRTSVVPKERYAFTPEVAALRDRDVVLCCVKSGGTVEAAEKMAPVLRPDALVVSFQNGVRNPDELRSRLSQEVLAGIVNFNILSKGSGVFRCATSGPLIVQSSASPASRALGAALGAAGFDVERSDAILELQWSKLIVNLNNSVTALSDRPIREVVFTPGYRRILAALVEEALDVLRAAGIRPAKLGRVPIGLFAVLMRLPTPLVRVIARAQLKIDPEARSSMWEDLTSGRLTEVEWLNGEVVRLAASCGADAPKNRRIVELVHEAERAGQGSPKLSADALWARLNET